MKTHRKCRLARHAQRRQGHDCHAEQSAEQHTVLVSISLRRWRRDQSRGTDCGGPRRLLYDGLSKQLGDAGFPAEKLTTTANVSLDQVEGGFASRLFISTLPAKCRASIKRNSKRSPPCDKENCPVSKVLNAKITLSAKLE